MEAHLRLLSCTLSSKLYTKRIDNLRMLLGYQPPKFQKFDRKGNPKQHIVHFVETCENARSRGDQLVRQFVRSLKGNAFELYTHSQTLLSTYLGCVWPVEVHSNWRVVNDDVRALRPIFKGPSKRPKKLRIPSTGKVNSSSTKCSSCHGKGHNSRTYQLHQIHQWCNPYSCIFIWLYCQMDLYWNLWVLFFQILHINKTCRCPCMYFWIET